MLSTILRALDRRLDCRWLHKYGDWATIDNVMVAHRIDGSGHLHGVIQKRTCERCGFEKVSVTVLNRQRVKA
jgi:glutaredoxin-related protein